MKLQSFLLATVALAVFGLCATPASAGGQFPQAELDGFGQTKAKSFDDFAGRAVLVEFFAFW